MEVCIVCKESLILLIFCFTLFPVILYSIIHIVKEKDKYIKGKYAVRLFVYLFIYFCIPFYKIIDILPFQHSTIEKSFKFDYNDIFNREIYGLIFKKKYKNTYFVVSRELNANRYTLDIFDCYSKNSNGWRPVTQTFDEKNGHYINGAYKIYYCSNKKDNITGIFITAISDLSNFKDNIKIKDKYGTQFDYIKNNKGEPIKYMKERNYVYFGVVDHSIDKDYYLKINGEKVKVKKKWRL